MFFAVPAAAAAARYASPSGSGTACTQTLPCSLSTAISGASSGDDVFAFANLGDYNLSSGINTSAGVPIHIHGFNGRARLIFASGGLRLMAGTADGLYLETDSDSSTTFALDTSAASADRVFAKQAFSSGNACYMDGATLRDSICWAPGAGLGMETDSSNTMRNDTIVGGTEAAIKAFGRHGCSCTSATDTLVNVIARSAAAGADLEANSDGTATANINASYSNYATTSTTGTISMDHITGDATDQSASPAFVNASAGDFHEAPSSPTIGAGLNAPANGATDLDGNPRELNGKTDIGAYEFVGASPTTGPAASPGGATSPSVVLPNTSAGTGAPPVQPLVALGVILLAAGLGFGGAVRHRSP